MIIIIERMKMSSRDKKKRINDKRHMYIWNMEDINRLLFIVRQD